MKHVCLALLCLLCAACARFEHPIVAESGPRFDDALAGHWMIESEEGLFEMDIRRAGDEGLVVLTSTKKGEAPETDTARLITARLERQTFASVAGVTADSNWLLFRYEFATPDRLVIYQDDDEFWDQAVNNRLIASRSDQDPDPKVRNATITASSDELRAFVLGYGGVIFKDQPAATFTRTP